VAERATKTSDNDRGQRLREIRQWLGLSQPEMAQWVIGDGASRVNISQAENNARPVPIERLGELFGVSADWMMGLSDERWGAQVQTIRAHLNRWLRDLPAEENARFMHPGERIAASYHQIQHISSLVTERYGAAILGIPLDQFRAVLKEESFVSQYHWERWAEWTNLPLRWIITGVQPATQDTLDALADYIPIMEEAKELGISPAHLLMVIRVIAKQ
jgi:DNA-binding XRE family transcriptional regulator